VATQCQPTTPTKAFLPHQRVTTEGKAMGMLRLSPEEAVKQMTASGLMDELDALIDKYKIDKAARRLSGDRTWLVASESIYGEFCGDTLTHAVHIFVLSYEANKNSLFV
jgi:hypothetical protein